MVGSPSSAAAKRGRRFSGTAAGLNRPGSHADTLLGEAARRLNSGWRAAHPRAHTGAADRRRANQGQPRDGPREEGVLEATLRLNEPQSDWQRHRLEAALD